MTDFRNFFQKSKNLTVLGSSYILSGAISAVFWLFLASILDVDQYGELGYLLALVGTVGAFGLIGSNNTLTVYVAKGVKIQATIFLVTLIAGITLSIGLLIFTQNILISFYPLAVIIFSTVIFDFLGKKAFTNYGKYLIIQRILMVTFALIFLEIWGINGIVFGYTLSLAVFVFLFYKAFQENKIDFKLLKDRKNFILNSYGTHVLEVVSINIDKLIIFPMFGALILGPYQLGFQIFILLLIIPSIVTQYTLPHDATGIKNKLLKKYTMIISGIIAVLTIILSPILIPIVFPKYIESIEVIQIMGFALIPSALTMILTSELLGKENSKSVILGVIVAIAALIIGIIILGEIMGLVGLAFSVVIARSLQCITLLILKKMNNNIKKQ
jgi:O-antigen/teichoic acid export membrane protein